MSFPARRQTPFSSTSVPDCLAPSTSSRRTNTFPRLVDHKVWTLGPSTGDPRRVIEERFDALSRKLVEVHTVATVVAPKRRNNPRARRVREHCPEQEDGAGNEQLSQEGRRGQVQQVEVIDHEHETGSPSAVFEGILRPGEKLYRIKSLPRSDFLGSAIGGQ